MIHQVHCCKMNSSDILPNTSALFSIIPALIAAFGLFQKRYKGELMPYYFVFCLFPELNYFLLHKALVASWIIAVLMCVQSILFALHFQRVIASKKLYFFTIPITLLCLTILFYEVGNSLDHPHFFPSNTATAVSIFITALCLIHYYTIFQKPSETPLFQQPYFIFSTGALIFFGGSSLTNYYHNSNLIKHHEWIDELLWQFHAVLLISFYSISSVFLWKIRSTKTQ